MALLRKMKGTGLIIVFVVLASITLAGIGWSFYLGIQTRSLIGEKVIIDGKELTITSVDGYDVILSDLTRVDRRYAISILKEPK